MKTDTGRPEPIPSDSQWLLTDLARETLLERRRARRWSIFFKLLTFVWLSAVLLWAAYGRTEGAVPPGSGSHTAMVSVQGIIADGEPASQGPVLDALTRAFEDENTAGIILSINSPGGSPVQSGILFDGIRRLRHAHPDIPVHAVLGDVAASGGYYIAVACDNIYANEASIVGSIGVRLDSFGATEAMKKLGIERRLLTAGANKGLLDPFLPEDPVAVAHVQSMLDNVHEQFIEAVKTGRGDRLSDNPQLFTGLIWSGEQAVENGLVDALSDTQSVATDVIGEADIVDYTERPDVFSRLADRVGASISSALSVALNPGLR